MSKKRFWSGKRTAGAFAALVVFLASAVGVIAFVTGKPSLPAILSPSSTPVPTSIPSLSPPPASSQNPLPSSESVHSAQIQYLKDMEPLKGSDYVIGGAQVINGHPYANSIADEVGGCSKEVTVEYDLGRKWETFHTMIGLSKDSGTDTKAQFQFLVNDVPVGPSYLIGVYDEREIPPIDVENKLRLKLTAVMLEGDMDLCSDAGDVVWGDARVLR